MSDSRRTSLVLFAIFLATVLVRLALSRCIGGPLIFSDELIYVEISRSLAQGKSLLFDGVQSAMPCWLYPAVIAPFFGFLEWDKAYAGVRTLNAILMALTIFPAYGLARELADRQRALMAAVLVALLPGLGYSPTVMMENLFFPVVMLAMWLLYRAALKPTVWRRLGAGLALGLGFHVKPHGALLPVIGLLTVLAYEACRALETPAGTTIPWSRRLAQFLRGVVRQWLMGLGWVLAMVPRVLIVLWVERPDHPFRIKAILGSYSGLAAGTHPLPPLVFFLICLLYLAGWIWTTGFTPAWIFGRDGLKALRGQYGERMRLMAVLTGVGTACMLGLVARHTATHNYPDTVKMHERYFFVMLPLIMIFFCVHGGAELKPAGPRAWARWFSFMLVAAVVVLYAREYTWDLSSSSPSFIGTMLVLLHKQVFKPFLTLYVALGLYTAWKVLRASDWPRQWRSVALMLVFFNVGWYGAHSQLVNRWFGPFRDIAKKVDRKLDRDDQLLVLSDGLGNATGWQATIRNPGQLYYLTDLSRPEWFTRKLELTADGQLKTEYPPQKAWLLADDGWKFNRVPDKRAHHCGLYYLGAPEPLRLDLGQVEQARKATSLDYLDNGSAFLDGLQLSLTDKQWPQEWRAKQSVSVRLRLRNDSKFALPGGKMKLVLGYAWLDPRQPAGQPLQIGPRDYAEVPADIAPGLTCKVKLRLRIPQAAGEERVLTLVPMILGPKSREMAATPFLSERITIKP